MSKRYYVTTAAVGLAAIGMIAGTAFAAQTRGTATLETPGTTRSLILPEAAAHSSVISLGNAVDPQSGRIVEGFAIVRRKGGNAKPDGAGGGKKSGGKKGGSTCHAYMAKGAKWKSVESWSVNPTNNQGLSDTYVWLNLESIAKWEDAADGVEGDANSIDILGDGVLTLATLEADTVSPDGVNEVYFGSIDDPGVVGVTIVWGIFGGSPQGRELVEWDQVYDEVDYGWSASGESTKMDFENVATHELGHSMGMTHPDDTCDLETMYRYTDYGETLRRDLHSGDTAGIDSLY